MQPLLSIESLHVSFAGEEGTVTAVKDVSFTIHPGETVAVVGESGSGKSVTSLSVLQLLPASITRYNAGRILFHSRNEGTINLLQATPAQLQRIRGNEIAMIFQEPMTSLNPVMSCGKQVMEALQLHRKLSARQAHAATLELLQQVQLPDPAAIFHRYPHQLSGGQKQRVMIAMAMSCQPSLLIADEPTTALDVTVQQTILQLMKQLQQQQGMGLLFITHDLGIVRDIADKVVVLYKGEVVEAAPVADLFANPVHPYTRALLACRPSLYSKTQRLPVVSDFLNAAATTMPTAAPASTTAAPAAAGDPLLQVQDLQVWFASKRNWLGRSQPAIKAVDKVSFDIFRGETVGLVGESGCGKTTLGRSLLRLVEPTGGRITCNGQDVLALSQHAFKEMRRSMQIVFQDPYSSLNPRMTVGAAIAEPMLVHQLVTNQKQAKEQAINLLEKVNLRADQYHRYPHEFSGGQRQRLVIARALALNPAFIVWDESVSALDVSVQAQVLNLLNDLKKDFGFTSLFISHDLSVVQYISDRILVMHKGRIVESGTAEEVYHRPKSDYTQQLLRAIPGSSMR